MPGRGTIPQILLMVDSIMRYTSENHVTRYGNIRPFNYVVLALLDCSKVFDVFNRVILLRRLREYGVHGLLLEWIAAFFEERMQSTYWGGYCLRLVCLGEVDRWGVSLFYYVF